jgi:hypothetical protein
VDVTAAAEGKYAATAEVTIELGSFVDGTFIPFADPLGDGTCTAATEFQAKVGAYEAAVIHACLAVLTAVMSCRYALSFTMTSALDSDAPRTIMLLSNVKAMLLSPLIMPSSSASTFDGALFLDVAITTTFPFLLH